MTPDIDYDYRISKNQRGDVLLYSVAATCTLCDKLIASESSPTSLAHMAASEKAEASAREHLEQHHSGD